MRKVNLLVASSLGTLPDGMHCDGQGLYLLVRGNSRNWVYRYKPVGAVHSRYMGLGAYPVIPLSQARSKRLQAQILRSQGSDPLTAKRTQQALQRTEIISFRKTVKAYMNIAIKGWTKAYADKWEQSLEDYAYPIIGNLPVSHINKNLVIMVLSPVWNNSPDLANRLRRKIEKVLDYAKAHNLRSGDNPALWKGNLEFAYTNSKPKGKINHHPALPYEEMYHFWLDLTSRETLASYALQLIILTVVRTEEAMAGKWDEIDFDTRVWTIPAQRIKTGKEHKVFLTDQALIVLEKLKPFSKENYLFTGEKDHLDLSACRKLIFRMNRSRKRSGLKMWIDPKEGNAPITPHGFRSTFRDWAADKTNHHNHVVEMALAHKIGNDVEAAYRRGELFEKRKALLEDWADFIVRK